MKREQLRIKLRDVRSHKDVFKHMMDQINRTMGLQSGGHHCLLLKSPGAGDPLHLLVSALGRKKHLTEPKEKQPLIDQKTTSTIPL